MARGNQQKLITSGVGNLVNPYLSSIFQRVERGQDFQMVAQSVAVETKLSAKQVARYVHAVIVAAEQFDKSNHKSFV
ncbi:MAG: hypothetical protein COA78_04415 [Blastopirellula sp.]|nr:MAG: hypothetical protein COA78_04415 [Blastopirellula sp.]